MSWTLFALLVLGLILLATGADLLVRASSRLAAGFGIPPVVVGLTLVAFGTSAPEAVVTAESALSGQTGIAVGNVVGSNIFNVLLILGICAIITPLVVSRRLVRLDVPVMLGASLLVLVFALDGSISRWQGLVLFAGIIGYTVALMLRVPPEALRRRTIDAQPQFRVEKAQRSEPEGAAPDRRAEGAGVARDARSDEGDFPSVSPDSTETSDLLRMPGKPVRRPVRDFLLVLVGLAFLVMGARWLINGASGIAQNLGVSDLVIGLTLVAAGTSLPELAASVTAAVRGQRDLAVGNIVGSNIFNLLFVLGIGSTLSPNGLPIAPVTLVFDLPVMMAVGIVCLPLFFTDYTLDRWEGSLFLAFYGGYAAFLFMRVTSGAEPYLSGTLLFYVLPLIAATLLMIGLRGRSARKAAGA